MYHVHVRIYKYQLCDAMRCSLLCIVSIAISGSVLQWFKHYKPYCIHTYMFSMWVIKFIVLIFVSTCNVTYIYMFTKFYLFLLHHFIYKAYKASMCSYKSILFETKSKRFSKNSRIYNSPFGTLNLFLTINYFSN